MALIHCYIGIENLGLDATQRATLIAGLGQLGAAPDGTHPELLNHRRVRPDGDAAIWEALFDDTTLTVAAIRQRLADIFGIAASQITPTTSTPSFAAGTSSAVVVYARPAGTNRLRFCQFGGVGATYAASHAEVLGYLAANAALWEVTP